MQVYTLFFSQWFINVLVCLLYCMLKIYSGVNACILTSILDTALASMLICGTENSVV